jgi:UDP-glucose 4-epimerase
MTVLVTGGAGYIGSHMVWALHDAGESVVVVDNLTTGFDWALPGNVPLISGDVGDIALVEKTIAQHGVDAVIHFAGSIIVPESVADPLKYYRNNTCVSRNLIEACVKSGVGQFIFSSTAAVYGDPDVIPVPEDAPLQPVSPYGASKLMTELMLRDVAAAHPFRYTALRYFNVAGADPQGRTGQSTAGATHLIKVASETALGKRSSMGIFGDDYPTPDGTAIRDYIHVSDLAAAHALALGRLRSGEASITMNCGYGHGYSVHEVIAAVRKVSGKAFKTELQPRRPGDSVKIVANSDLIRAELGWKPAHDNLEEIVAHALSWEDRLAKRNLVG